MAYSFGFMSLSILTNNSCLKKHLGKLTEPRSQWLRLISAISTCAFVILLDRHGSPSPLVDIGYWTEIMPSASADILNYLGQFRLDIKVRKTLKGAVMIIFLKRNNLSQSCKLAAKSILLLFTWTIYWKMGTFLAVAVITLKTDLSAKRVNMQNALAQNQWMISALT